jgi:rSAM/selenodomain-associated transferase 2
MISIVMPVFNEAEGLRVCLDRILANDGDYELIVVDGGSTDNSLAIASSYRSTRPLRVLTASKGRGSQMNAGAQAARGEWLLFLHADTIIEKDAIKKLTACAARAELQAGCFWHRFDSAHPWLHIVSFFHNLRFRWTHIIYGDQCLFIRRELFFTAGAFREGIVMEDIEFSERLLKYTRPRCLPLVALTSARKFHAIGVYRATLKVLALMRAYDRKKDVRKDLFFSDIR